MRKVPPPIYIGMYITFFFEDIYNPKTTDPYKSNSKI